MLLLYWNPYIYFLFAILINILIYPFGKYSIYSISKYNDPLFDFLQKTCTAYCIELFKKAKKRARI
jgi:TRAP-type uncharacterized transport system fused permease subunit